jgi:hypothetical protein
LVEYLKVEGWPKAFRQVLPKRLRRRIPDEATLSRRFRAESLAVLFRRVLGVLAMPSRHAAVDGLILAVGPHSHDAEARFGGPGSHFMRGYKAVRTVNAFGQALDVELGSAAQQEIELVKPVLVRLREAGHAFDRLLADGAYDSEELHRLVAETLRAVLIAPVYARGFKPAKGRRRRCAGRHRRAMQRLLRTAWGKHWYKNRLIVERSNGWLRLPPFNLGMLPSFVRHTHRVRRWLLSLEILLSYRIALRCGQHAA